MSIFTRRIALAVPSVALAVGLLAGCSSTDNTDSAASTSDATISAEATLTDEPEPDYSASVVPDPTSLEAETAEPTDTPEPTPTREAENGFTREPDVVPCEQALDIDVINVTVPGSVKAFLNRVVGNKPESRLIYSETCVYTVRTAGGYVKGVAYVTSSRLTAKGQEFYRNTCAHGLMNSDNLVGKRIGYQFYGNIDDGCTFAPKSSAPSGVLPGFVLRYRKQMVTVQLQGFDKVASDGEAVIRKVELKPES